MQRKAKKNKTKETFKDSKNYNSAQAHIYKNKLTKKYIINFKHNLKRNIRKQIEKRKEKKRKNK